MQQMKLIATGMGIALSLASTFSAEAQPTPKPAPDNTSRILTPPAPATPRINGARIYGQRPGRPFLFTIPATGERPMTFTAQGLPDGLKIDESTGRITGSVKAAGE